MITRLVITDLTRMHRGKVCIAGYTAEHQCIRPTLPPPGIPESILIDNGTPIIYPFALIELDLLCQRPQPPHIEDCDFDPDSVRFIRIVKDRQTVLTWSLFNKLSEIFEQPIHDDHGFYVMDKIGSRSIGTIKPRQIFKVIYESGIDGTWDYRLHFYDSSETFYRLKITDLTWHYYCDSLRSPSQTPETIGDMLTETMQTRKVYLRIGLSRGWSKFPDRCYLQINGIYTFPDYLEGKTFFDFSPNM